MTIYIAEFISVSDIGMYIGRITAVTVIAEMKCLFLMSRTAFRQVVELGCRSAVFTFAGRWAARCAVRCTAALDDDGNNRYLF